MDRYQFYDAVGKGRHSTVYKGRQKDTVEYLAIKRVDKAQKDRVYNEVYIMHKMAGHPHRLRFPAQAAKSAPSASQPQSAAALAEPWPASPSSSATPTVLQ